MTLRPGDAAPDFTLPDTDGTPVRLHAGEAAATVVVFTCNHCPYALAWHARIEAVARDYAGRDVRTLQICSNDAERYPRDSPDGDARHGCRPASSPAPTCTTRRRPSRGHGARG